jgi:hypothetical protein
MLHAWSQAECIVLLLLHVFIQKLCWVSLSIRDDRRIALCMLERCLPGLASLSP